MDVNVLICGISGLKYKSDRCENACPLIVLVCKETQRLIPE